MREVLQIGVHKTVFRELEKVPYIGQNNLFSFLTVINIFLLGFCGLLWQKYCCGHSNIHRGMGSWILLSYGVQLLINNQSVSYNASMKRLISWKQRRIDVLANSLRKLPHFLKLKFGEVGWDVATTHFFLFLYIHIKTWHWSNWQTSPWMIFSIKLSLLTIQNMVKVDFLNAYN